MTDPGFADRTYLEPLDVEGVTAVLRRERPDAVLATMGGGTALNLARELQQAGIFDELGIELIGAKIDAIQRAEDRELFKADRRGLWPPGADVAHRHVDRRSRRHRAARGRPAGVHARRARRRLRRHAGSAAGTGRARPLRVTDQPGARRGVGARLGRVRARGRARPRRQRRDRLFDREPRPDGRAYRRLGHRRTADDAQRRGLPGAARRGDRGHPRSRRRYGRLEHPVRARPRSPATSA